MTTGILRAPAPLSDPPNGLLLSLSLPLLEVAVALLLALVANPVGRPALEAAV
jgi:hypothetical protein